MRVIIVGRDQTDYARTIIDYLRDFKHQTGHDIEIIDPDTQDGIDFCRAYDIMEYPCVVAIDYRGVMQNMWRGLPLPTISELSFYLQGN